MTNTNQLPIYKELVIKKNCNSCMKLKLYNAEWRKIGKREVCPACAQSINAANKIAKQRASMKLMII